MMKFNTNKKMGDKLIINNNNDKKKTNKLSIQIDSTTKKNKRLCVFNSSCYQIYIYFFFLSIFSIHI